MQKTHGTQRREEVIIVKTYMLKFSNKDISTPLAITIIIVLVVIVAVGILWFLNQNNNYSCSTDSDCVKTCCGCINIKDKRCDGRECEALPEGKCICVNSQCVLEQENK